MNQTNPSILVAMSGGVDSSTAAALLKQQGFHVKGLYMDMGLAHKNRLDSEGRIVNDKTDAQRIADQLDIELQIVDFRDSIRQVIDYFIAEYRHARTPNPCIMCNRKLKFGRILQFAESIGTDQIATGHYARILNESGQFQLCRASNHAKDQSYALFGIGYQNLPRIRFPLGDFSKDAIREMAQQMDLPVHDKGDSQEICFVPDDDYVRFLEELAPDLKQSGKIIDTRGNILGNHQGIYRYTIGQRRGLGIALGIPAYVVDIDARNHTVTLGNNDDLLRETLVVENTCWMLSTPPGEPFHATVQIRYNHRGSPATVIPHPETNSATVQFNVPVRAVTPGQAAVFYQNTQVLGGGWIASSSDFKSFQM